MDPWSSQKYRIYRKGGILKLLKRKNIVCNVIGHSPDLDGYASMAIAIEFLVGHNISCHKINVIPVNHNSYNIERIMSKYYNPNWKKTVITIIGDFTFRENDMKLLIENSDLFLWTDHHQSQIRIYENIIKQFDYRLKNKSLQVNYDTKNKYSGAYCMYKLLYQNFEIPHIIKIISDGDTYKWHYSNSKSILQFISLVDWRNLDQLRNIIFRNSFFGKFTFQSSEKLCEWMYDVGDLLFLNRNKMINNIITYNMAIVDFHGIPCGIINCTHGELISDICNKMANAVNGIGMSYSDKISKQCRSFSLRCSHEKDIDIPQLIEKQGYNGGGHKHSAGFDLPLDKGIKLVDDLLKNHRID